MYEDTIEYFSDLARKKSAFLSCSPIAFAIGSIMAGAYVGLGIILILSVAEPIDPELQKLVMGVSFGIALTLVVFAGAELFTGYTMYMVFGLFKGTITLQDLCRAWFTSWSFNFVGAVLLTLLFSAGGGGVLFAEGASLLHKIATAKMNAGVIELISKGALCNWLVCLALWMTARISSEPGKMIAIFWCLFAFIASGFEHSVANMTLLTLAVISEHPDSISIAGLAYNLTWVTLGNILGGSLFIGAGYWYASGGPSKNALTTRGATE